MNNNSLITYCKYCLVDRYKATFTKQCPVKEEILDAIFKHYFNKEDFKEVSSLGVFKLFYELEAKDYSNLSFKAKQRVKRKNKPNGLEYCNQLSEGSSVNPEPVVSRKTQVFFRYINPHNIDLNTVPF